MARPAFVLAGLLVSADAQTPPRAVPVDEGVPPRAVPVVEPSVPKAQAVRDPSRPKGPDEDLFEYATLAYSQQDYAIAIQPYSDYTRMYPNGTHAAEAWFRLGECYAKTGKQAEAMRAWNDTIMRHPKSESASSAAYRLGATAYANRDFLRGITWFEITERQSTSVDIRTAATFNKALCLKYAGQKDKALTAFKKVAANAGATMSREAEIARSEMATLALETGNKDDALNAFTQILATTKDPKLAGDALVRSGLILNEMGRGDDAMKNFRRALATPDLPADLKGIAAFGLIQASFVKGDYDSVISAYTDHAGTLVSPDLNPKKLLIVGTAYKNKQMYRQAIEVFLLLEKNHPDAPEALDAGYQKLLCFHQMGDKDLPLFTERFEERYKERYPDHEYLLMSRLIRADWWFSKADYPKAADAFVNVSPDRVPEKVRASVIYKKGFAEAEAGRSADAVVSLTRFITDNPKDLNIPVALAQRGLAQKNLRSFDKALADFSTVLKDFPDHPAAELSLYQTGLIKAETRDTPGMITAFEMLVQKFPNSPAIAEASYRTGRGYFDLGTKDGYGKALAPLRRSIAADADTWLDKSSQLLISCQYLREDVDGLAKEVDAYLDKRRDASIPPKPLLFLGVKYFERGNYRSSARYLSLASTPDAPQNTEPLLWSYLGQAQAKNGDHEKAVASLDHYLAATPGGEGRARALLHKGRALLALGKFSEADACASEGNEMVKEGKVHAEFQILRGDIAFAHGDALAASGDNTAALEAWKKAAGNFVVVSQIFVDPEITPLAADKAARALDKIGEKTKADALRKQLQAKYPDYKPAA